MKKHRLTLPIFLAVSLFTIIAIILSFINDRTLSVPMSDNAAKILSNEGYYLSYTTQWLLADNQVVKVEEALDNGAFLQKYEMDGKPLISVTSGNSVSVFWENELIQELKNSDLQTAPYSNLQFNGVCGNRMLDGNDLYYEEYDYTFNNKKHRLRFLFSDQQLWGLQFDKDNQYVKVITLSKEIPEDLSALIKN